MRVLAGLDVTLKDYKDMLFKSKKYLIIYLFLILILGLSTASQKNLYHPEFVILTFVIVAILGVFCILFYLLHDSDKELHKVAFVFILCFGIACTLIVPICDVSDETEHLARAEITSQGVIIPHWTGEDAGIERLYNYTEGEKISSEKNRGVGYYSISSMNFFKKNLGLTVFDSQHDTDKINNTQVIVESAFEQNPFFGYLPQAIGILIAKLLDLNVIWILWLARICNLLFYACVVSLAIRKAPVLKIPLLAVACIPISLYQSSSASIDAMIISLSILEVSYFIYMCKSPKDSLSKKDIGIFSVICVFLGLCKLPYLAFIFLLLFVPSKNFSMERKNVYSTMLIAIIIVGIIGLLWSRYSAPTLMHSWRSSHNLINSTLQTEYILDNPMHIVKFFNNIFFVELPKMIAGVFNFFGARQYHHYVDKYYLVSIMAVGYLAVTLLAYPRNVEFELKTKLGSIFIVLLIYIGTCFIQLLTWASVGFFNLGISTRYFVPLLALLPIAIWINKKPMDGDKFDKYAIVFMVAFMATLIISFATKYYTFN